MRFGPEVRPDRHRDDAEPRAVTLRVMRPADVEEVVYIENRSFQVPWSERTFKSLLRQRHAALFVAEKEGRVVGYAAVWFVADEAELGDLAVHPENRGRGIGTRLLERALDEARRRSIRALYLEVRAGNESAKCMYERAGFDVISVRRDYYTQPVEDALVMRYLFDDRLR